MKRARRPTQRGFTLVELMISLVLFLVAIAGTLNIAVTMSQAYRDQRNVILTESAVRAPMDFMADAIRNASPGVKTGDVDSVLANGTGCNNWNQSVLYPLPNNGAISVVDNVDAPDELWVTYASGAVVTTLRTPWDKNTTSITVTDASQLSPGDLLLITDTNQGTVVQIDSAAGSVDTVSGVITLVAAACPTTRTYSTGTTLPLVLRVKRARFYVDTLGSVTDGVPTLMMDPDGEGPAQPEPLAENIEDMQVALGVDVNANGGIESTTTDANHQAAGGEWAYSSGTTGLIGSIRAVRITLIARAPNQLVPLVASYQRPNTEDRTDLAPLDTYRRRILTSTIEVRNLTGSP